MFSVFRHSQFFNLVDFFSLLIRVKLTHQLNLNLRPGNLSAFFGGLEKRNFCIFQSAIAEFPLFRRSMYVQNEVTAFMNAV